MHGGRLDESQALKGKGLVENRIDCLQDRGHRAEGVLQWDRKKCLSGVFMRFFKKAAHLIEGDGHCALE